MASILVRLLLFFSAVSILCPQEPCNMHSIAGTWAASSVGTMYAPSPDGNGQVPVRGAALGLVSITPEGVIDIDLTANSGTVGTPRLKGTVSIKPDCSGSFQADSLGPMKWRMEEDFFLFNHGTEVRTFSTCRMMNMPVVWHCHWKRMSRTPLPSSGELPEYRNLRVRGSWIGTFDGITHVTWDTKPIPTAIRTFIVVDFWNAVTGNYTASVAGTMLTGTIEGTVEELKPNGVGVMKWIRKDLDGNTLDGEAIEKIVVLDKGREIWGLPLQGVLGMPVGVTRYTQTSIYPFE